MRKLLPLAAVALGAAASSSPARAQSPGIDVDRYRFEITLPTSGTTIRVASTLAFARAAGTRELKVDLLAPMQVEAVTLGCDAAAPARFTHDGRVVRIALGDAPASGGTGGTTERARTECATVRYAGAPADGLIISTDTAGRWRAFGDNWPDRGRHWLATVDHPSDKALVEFVVDAPASLRVIANGTERSVTERTGNPARRVTTWASTQPIPTYLMVIAAAPLVMTDLGATACGLSAVTRCVPQRIWTAPEQQRYMPGHFVEADSIVRFFARLVGPFPYAQLQHLQSSTRFGGMENAGAIFYNDALFRRPMGVDVGLIAHETAHQWFGDAVTEREWGHLWLSEGFATYFAALYTEHSRGAVPFAKQMAEIRAQILEAREVASRPVLDTAQTNLLELLNTNSYQKGGYVLHMLRREVGDSAFFRGVRDYWTTHRHGNALTADLQRAVEAEHGQPLGWFFDQWLRKPGFAEVTYAWSFDADARKVSIQVDQTGRFGAYRLRVPVRISGPNGEIQEGAVNVSASRSVIVEVPWVGMGAPAQVTLDPQQVILGRFTSR